LGYFPENLKISWGDILSPAMQGVMELLGHLEELVVSFNGIP
jgi:hypothetical protein